jgi:hypothetical protein
MRQDLLDSSSENLRRRIGLVRALAAALIVLGVASIAFLVQPDARKPALGDFGVASVAGVADVAAQAAPTELSQPSTAAPAQDGAAARGERADEPTVDDATNPHGG